jgi:hypothetical protein
VSIEVARRRGKRCKQLLEDIKETRRYLRLEGKVLDLSWWRTHFRRDCEPVVRQTTGLMNTFASFIKYGILLSCFALTSLIEGCWELK